MTRSVILISAVMFMGVCTAMGTTHTVSASGFTFTPDTLLITTGDTVKFVIAAMHDAAEVSQSTWLANDTTSLPGGFKVPFGGGSAVLTDVGTHFYVCQAHVSFGMKAVIIVSPAATDTITVAHLVDQDGNLATSGDRLPKDWGLSLYHDSVAAGTLVASTASGTSITATNVIPGTYIAVETDSSGWFHTGVSVDDGAATASESPQWTITVGAAENHTVTFINFARNIILSSGFTFSPDSIMIVTGDTVRFVLDPMHTAREVSQATWDVNGTTSNGGFDLPSGGGSAAVNGLGTHYYTCVPHASIGMKGRIIAAAGITRGIDIGWNMISLPLAVTDNSVAAQYPGAVSQAFSYSGRYEAQTQLQNGTGYWLKFNTGGGASTFGTPINRDTVDVSNGWNMIGSISSPLAIGSVTTIPSGIVVSNYFGYSNGYTVADTIAPGFGYWVKVNQNGKLILDSGGVTLPPRTAARKSPPEFAGRLIFIDNAGRSRTLYWLKAPPESNDALDRGELPPLPPEGSFDVRFSDDHQYFISGSVLKAGPTSREARRITISSAVYPVRLTWEFPGGQGTLTLTIQGEALALTGKGSVELTAPDRSLMLSAEGSGTIPREFALGPAFPNPFNPSTVIRYSLPAASYVAVRIYDILGQEVTTLVNGNQEAGNKSVTWDASNAASGVYFVRLEASGVSGGAKPALLTMKVVLQK